MQRTAAIAQIIVRITGVIQIVLGLLIWVGIATQFIPLHMISGALLVLGLWVLAFQAIQSGANPRLGMISLIWGLIVLGLGMTQAQLLVGPAHWVIQVLHVLLGLGAMGQAERLAGSLLGRRTAVSGM